MTKATRHRIGVIAVVALLCGGTLHAQRPVRLVDEPGALFKATRITFVAGTPPTTALRESITRELRRQAQADPQTPAPTPKEKMKTLGRKAGMVAIIIGAAVGVAYLVVWARAE